MEYEVKCIVEAAIIYSLLLVGDLFLRIMEESWRDN